MGETTQVVAEDGVREAARDLDYDRYLAALLSPKVARLDLMTIAAFLGEIARVPVVVHEPTIAAIRLQWWRDVIENRGSGEAPGSPVAEGVQRLLCADDAAVEDAISIVDAYEELLHPGALSRPGAVEAFATMGQGAAFGWAARRLGIGAASGSELIRAASQAYGRVQLIRALPGLLRRGHNPFVAPNTGDWEMITGVLIARTRNAMAEVRRLAPLAPAAIRDVILPVALVEPYLAALEGLGSKLIDEQATISPLTRVWRIYVAKRLGRF